MKYLINIFCLLIASAAFAQAPVRFSVYFESGQAKLTNEAKAEIAKELEKVKGPKAAWSVRLSGHTDDVGNESYNQFLSESRSRTVANELVRSGFYRPKIITAGHAYHKPATENASDVGRGKNRRVEVVIHRSPKEPSLPKADVRASINPVDAETGGTFFYKSGTRIEVPAHALVDKHGNPVTGKVDIHYREFRNAAEQITSGLPMDYDSAGKKYWFESGGMFELTAQQNGEELQMAPGAEVKVDFMLTTDKHFEFYRLQENGRWQNQTQQAVRPVQFAQAEAQPLQPIGNMLGEKVMIEGNFEAEECQKNDEDLRFLAIQEGFNRVAPNKVHQALNFNQRYGSFQYAGTRKITSDTVGLPIALTQIQNRKRIHFELEDLSGEYDELAALGNVTFYMRGRNPGRLKKYGQRSEWHDVRLRMTKSGRVQLILKDDRRLVKAYVEASVDGVRGRKKTLAAMQDIFAKYKRTLRKRGRNFDENLRKENKELNRIADRKTWSTSLNNTCFYEYSKEWMTDEEAAMEQKDWLGWFHKNKELMLERYDALQLTNQKRIKQARRKVQVAQQRQKHIPGVRFRIAQDGVGLDREGWWGASANANNLMSDEGKANYDEQLADLNARIDAAEGAEKEQLMAQRYNMVGHYYPNLIRGLGVKGFGVYNNDRAGSLTQPLMVKAEYKDKDGNEINAAYLSVVNYKLNSAMSNDPYRFQVSTDSPNAFVVFDTDENVYLMNRDEASDFTFQGNNATNTLIVRNITDELDSSDDLRELLNLKP